MLTSERRADRLFSEIITSVGRCDYCRSDSQLTCAHIISRRFKSTRWDLDNAICLCFNHHRYFTEHPAEWIEYIDSRLGVGFYDRMRMKANEVFRGDVADIVRGLEVALDR